MSDSRITLFHYHFFKILPSSQKSYFHKFFNYFFCELVGMIIFCIHLSVEIARNTILNVTPCFFILSLNLDFCIIPGFWKIVWPQFCKPLHRFSKFSEYLLTDTTNHIDISRKKIMITWANTFIGDIIAL